MIVSPSFSGKNVAVVGLGISGIAAAKSLQAGGAKVLAWDDGETQRDELAALGLQATSPTEMDWNDIAALVLSPGIPHTLPAPHAAAALAKSHGVPIVGDIELLIRAQPDATYVCITGSNGKSTTTALTAHALAGGARPVAVGGNLGMAALTLPALGSDGIYVLELSSYQLELTPGLKPKAAALLNITPDHLDRHGDMQGYAAAKARIFAKMDPGDIAVIGDDDEDCRRIAAGLNGPRIVGISSAHDLPRGVHAEGDALVDDAFDAGCVLKLSDCPTLPGSHNAQNICAAFALCRAVGLPADIFAQRARSFPGLAHRQQLVARIGRVAYVNDSKATNADATAKALACYDRIYWIAGGKPKAGGLTGLEEFMPRIAKAYLIGAAEMAFAAQLQGQCAVERCGALDRAVAMAHADAQADAGVKNPVVLLSPACASFDQFRNFEHRGQVFAEQVKMLAREEAA